MSPPQLRNLYRSTRLVRVTQTQQGNWGCSPPTAASVNGCPQYARRHAVHFSDGAPWQRRTARPVGCTGRRDVSAAPHAALARAKDSRFLSSAFGNASRQSWARRFRNLRPDVSNRDYSKTNSLRTLMPDIFSFIKDTPLCYSVSDCAD